MKTTKLFLLTLVIAIVALAATTIGFAQDASCDTVVITNDDVARQQENTPPTRNWVLYTRTPTSLGTFRTGPGSPPSGVGSLETVTPTGGDKVYIFNYDHIGTLLADIDKMGYATYRSAGTGVALPALNLQVDINGGALLPGDFTTLVFEPYFNTDQPAVQDATWQTWDAYNGGQAMWWSTRAIPGVACVHCPVTWNQIVSANPNATIVGGYGINQGSGNPGITASSDVLSISYDDVCVTYDFEPYKVATSKDACKNGGWKTLRRADGSSFKNQGDCVSYVSNGK